jgi:hypothetical protein
MGYVNLKGGIVSPAIIIKQMKQGHRIRPARHGHHHSIAGHQQFTLRDRLSESSFQIGF